MINRAIDSILQQTHSNFELLIADDCSKDSTKSIIDSYKDPRIKTFHNAINLGYLKASNKLFMQCSGEYITFQDADDFSENNRFEKLVNFLNEHRDVDCVGSNVIKVDMNEKKIGASNFPLTDPDIRTSFSNYYTVFTGAALMLKKRVLEKTGLYNEYFNRVGSEDIYLYSHILDHFKVANLSDALYYYRFNPNSVTSTHKNPKAFVGHELILFMYKRRKEKKKDFIAENNWKKADICVKFLLAIKKGKTSVTGGISDFFKASMQSPALSLNFIRPFIANIKSKSKT